MSCGGAAAFMFACGLLGRKGLAHGGTPAALLRKLKAESFVVDALLFLLFSHSHFSLKNSKKPCWELPCLVSEAVTPMVKAESETLGP